MIMRNFSIRKCCHDSRAERIPYSLQQFINLKNKSDSIEKKYVNDKILNPTKKIAESLWITLQSSLLLIS